VTAEELEAIGAREVLLGQVDVRLDALDSLGRHPLLPPTVPNTWAVEDGLEWLWLGPDEWLVLAEPDAATDVVARLEAALGGLHRSIVDVSASRTVLDLAGEGRLDLLAHGCGLDLDPRSWGSGRCAQTLLGRVPVLLQERGASTRVFVRPSFARWLVAWLSAVAGPA
jgi:sarcosine oxidase subunit gamma